jgi:release factor glutamine methyltransferase
VPRAYAAAPGRTRASAAYAGPVVEQRAGQGSEQAVVDRLRAAGCVFAEDEARLLVEAASGDRLEALVRRRVAGEPLEQVLGWALFDGLRVAVEPGVFVPRRRTELLVDVADELLGAPDGEGGPVVVELCCGVAAVAAALLHRRPGLDLVAADLDPAAVRCARRTLGARATVLEGDLFDPLPPRLLGRVDVLVANAPYVPTSAIATMPPEARLHESPLALDGGADGLDLHRRIAGEARAWLAPGGSVLVETSEAQADATEALLAAAGLATRVHRDDDRDATVVQGRREARVG